MLNSLLALLIIGAVVYLLARVICRKLWQTIVFWGVIVIFFSWLLVSALKSTHQSIKMSDCASNMKQLGLACHMYAQDNNEKFPSELIQLYPVYVSKASLFFCPFTPDKIAPKEIKTREDAEISYLLTPGLTKKDDSDSILIRDRSNWNTPGINCCFVDGRVQHIWLNKFIERDFDTLALALQAFYKKKNRYPANTDGLEELVKSGYLRVMLIDPVDLEGKRPYGYAFDNIHNKWILTSYGPNKKPDINLSLYAQGKLSNQDLMKMQAQFIFGMATIKRTNGDVFRVGP